MEFELERKRCNCPSHQRSCIGILTDNPKAARSATARSISAGEVGVANAGPHSGRKDLGWLGILAPGFNINNSLLVFAATMSVSLSYGPMLTISGIIFVAVMYMCIGLTLAELVSAYPTAGGQYHWTSILAPRSINNPASYLCGMIGWFSWLALSASSQGAMALCVFALTTNTNPSFAIHSWQYFLVYQVMNALSLFANVFLRKWLGRIYTGGFILSLVSFVAMSCTALAMQRHKASSDFVWTTATSISGWPVGVEFLIALSSPVVAFRPVDGAVHLVEEVSHASRVVPQTILCALFISFLTTLAFALATLYSISDLDVFLNSASGFLVFEAWQQATRSETAAIVFTVVVMVLLPVGSIACTEVAAMMTCSLGRDPGLIYLHMWAAIYPRLNAPVRALLLNWFFMFLVGCLYLVSDLAFNAIIGIAIILQQVTMEIPTSILLARHLSLSSLPPTRSVALPHWLCWICNTVTVAFTVITTVFFQFPVSRAGLDASTMNYACAVVSAILVLTAVNWFAFAKRHYCGPLNIELYD